MYILLTVVAAILGFCVVVISVLMGWFFFIRRHANQKAPKQFMQWSWFDYGLLIILLIGLLFLFTDLIGVLKDRESYPYYHFGYLLSGFIYTSLGTILLLVRLAVVFKWHKLGSGGDSSASSTSLDNHNEPE